MGQNKIHKKYIFPQLDQIGISQVDKLSNVFSVYFFYWKPARREMLKKLVSFIAFKLTILTMQNNNIF